MDILELARRSGMTVTLDARIGREEYRTVHGSVAALGAFFRTVGGDVVWKTRSGRINAPRALIELEGTGQIMKYDSSNYGNGGSNSRRLEERAELERAPQPALQSVEETAKAPSAARNWAWAHNTESYDWMDSAQPFSTEETLH